MFCFRSLNGGCESCQIRFLIFLRNGNEHSNRFVTFWPSNHATVCSHFESLQDIVRKPRKRPRPSLSSKHGDNTRRDLFHERARVMVIPSRVCRGCSAATEGPTRLHTEHPDIEKRVRAQNSVVHKPFACKRESNSRPQLAFSSWNERVFVFSRKRSKRCDKEITY